MSRRARHPDRHWRTALLLWAGAGLLYANTLDVPFTFDDSQNIAANRNIRIDSLDLDALRRAAFESPSPRPLANLGFALDYYLHGYEPAGWHLVNIAIHGGAAALVFLIALRLLEHEASLRDDRASGVPGKPPGPSRKAPGRALRASQAIAHRERRWWAAAFAGAVFLCHPIQTQAVTYVVQRMTSGATLFALLAFWLFILGRDREGRARWSLYAAAALAWSLGLLTKPIAVTLPVALCLYEWFFRQDLDLRWLKRRALWLVVPIGLVALVGLAYLGLDPVAGIEASYAVRDFGIAERVMTQWRVLVFYLGLVALPLPGRLSLIHGFDVSRSLFHPWTTLPALGSLLGFGLLAVWLARRERLASFCMLWFALQLALESSVIGLEMAYEHRLYQPMLGLAVLAGALLFTRGRWALAPRVGIAAAVVAALAIGTWTRNEIWRDPVALWSDVVAKNPERFRPRNNLALALADARRLPEATEQYQKAIEIDGDVAAVHSNLGLTLTRQHRFDEALVHLRAARDLDPENSGAATNLGHLFTSMGRPAEAIPHFEAAIAPDPEFAEGHYNLADALLAVGRLDEADAHARVALRLSPGLAAAHDLRGRVLAKRGEYEAALSHYREAIRLTPDLANPHHNLGLALSRLGRIDEAYASQRRALALQPRSPIFLNSMGVVHARRGEYELALDALDRALRIRPDYEEARRNRLQVLRLMPRANGGARGSGAR